MPYPNNQPRPPDEESVIGHPVGGLNGDPGDPGCFLGQKIWLPTTGVSPPWPIILATDAPGFNRTGGGNGEFLALTDMADLGFMCVYHDVRPMTDPLLRGKPATPLPGQTTDGRYSMQTNDCLQVLRLYRADPRGIGFIGYYGGSGSAHHGGYMACWPGVVAGDRADCAIMMSPPLVPGDPQSRLSLGFKQDTVDYARGDINDDSQAQLDYLNSLFPIAFVNAGMKPNPLFHYNSENENMPKNNLLVFQQAIIDQGFQDIYTAYYLLGGTTHSFAGWSGPPDARSQAVPWLQQVYADWLVANGGGGGGGGETPTREKVVVAISGLDPGLPMIFSAGAKSNITGLSGPLTPFEFVSDKDVGGSGGSIDPASGNYVLVPSPGGVPPDLTTKPYWDFAYIDGTKVETNMSVVNPGPQSFVWNVVDTYLATCATKGKPGGLAISAGLATPAWVYQKGATKFDLSGGGSMPPIWDQTYISAMKKLIKAAAERFDGNPGLRYITVGGLGQGVSTFLVGDADFNALTLIAQADGYPTIVDGWTFGCQQLIDYTLKAFKMTFSFIQIDYPVPLSQGGLTAISNLVDWATSSFGHRFGLSNSNLTGATNDDGLIDTLMLDSAMDVQTGYQFEFPSTDPACDPTQDPGSYDPVTGFQNAANAAISLRAALLEYQEVDALNTTDPYPADFSTFQTSLEDNSHGP